MDNNTCSYGTRNSLCWNKLGRPEARARKLGRSTSRQSAELPFTASGRDALIMTTCRRGSTCLDGPAVRTYFQATHLWVIIHHVLSQYPETLPMRLPSTAIYTNSNPGIPTAMCSMTCMLLLLSVMTTCIVGRHWLFTCNAIGALKLGCPLKIRF